jgi:hypothetical protein
MTGTDEASLALTTHAGKPEDVYAACGVTRVGLRALAARYLGAVRNLRWSGAGSKCASRCGVGGLSRSVGSTEASRRTK